MNGFSIPPVVQDHNKTNEILGHNWLSHQVDASLKAADKKQPLHPSTMSPAFGWVSHPLISEVEQHRLNGQRTLLLDSIEKDIRDLVGITLPSDLRSRLRDDHDFSKAAYELRIAAGYNRLGYSLAWCPSMKQPHPEFIVHMGDSNILAVECKKRDAVDGYEQEAGRFWKHFQYSLRKKMEVEPLNYWVKVSGREFRLEDIEYLVTEIISVIKANKNGQFDSELGRYQIEYVWLADPGGSIPTEVVNMFPRGTRGINAGRQDRNQIMSGPLTDPKLIRLEFIDDQEHRVKGLIRNLKTASKQVIKGALNLIYIDINMHDYKQEQAEFENMKKAIIEELNARHRHVSAVVLTDIYPSMSLDEHLGWRVRTELIIQAKPTVSLPNNLRFPGDMADTQWLPGDIFRPI